MQGQKLINAPQKFRFFRSKVQLRFRKFRFFFPSFISVFTLLYEKTARPHRLASRRPSSVSIVREILSISRHLFRSFSRAARNYAPRPVGVFPSSGTQSARRFPAVCEAVRTCTHSYKCHFVIPASDAAVWFELPPALSPQACIVLPPSIPCSVSGA